MRVFALQTNVDVLKKRYLVPDEQELLTIHMHVLAFLWPLFGYGLLTIALLSVYAYMVQTGEWQPLYGAVLLLVWICIAIERCVRGFIRWRYNFLIVTTDKVIPVEHRLFFEQEVNPIHLQNIASTKAATQLWGLVRAGILHLHLKEREEASTRCIRLRFIPCVTDVAGVIENAIVLMRHHAGNSSADTTKKEIVQYIREKGLDV